MTFESMFDQQASNQEKLLSSGMYDDFSSINKDSVLPVDDPKLCSYHVQQLVSEIGEVLEADKRWKNFRNEKCDSANKKDELADCFIVWMNMCLYSGFDSSDMAEAIEKKLKVVSDRIESTCK